MRAWLMFAIILIGAGLFFWDWNEEKLVRIDVRLENRDVHLVGDDLEDIKPLIEKVDWSAEVKAQEGDAEYHIVLFYEDDPDMPERLEHFYIWNQEDDSAIVFNDYEGRYGSLDEASAEQIINKIETNSNS